MENLFKFLNSVIFNLKKSRFDQKIKSMKSLKRSSFSLVSDTTFSCTLNQTYSEDEEYVFCGVALIANEATKIDTKFLTCDPDHQHHQDQDHQDHHQDQDHQDQQDHRQDHHQDQGGSRDGRQIILSNCSAVSPVAEGKIQIFVKIM